jgi:Cu(I)/Ag(I) efflux system membrane fusion protein
MMAAAIGWYTGSRHSPPAAPLKTEKILYYQSPMHPWVKSDKPGNCTICGMKLSPVYAEDKSVAVDSNILVLSSGAVSSLDVRTEKVAKRPITKLLQVAGQIESETRSRVVSAPYDARVDEVLVPLEGTAVTQSQPLARIFSPTLRAAQADYLSALAEASKNPQNVKSNEGAIMVNDAKQRLYTFNLSPGQIEELSKTNERNLANHILSPISGTITRRLVQEGQYVNLGDPLFEILDLSKNSFRFNVNEQDLSWISKGQPVEVTPANVGESYKGVITFIDPNIDQSSRTAQIRVQLAFQVVQAARQRPQLFNGIYAEGEVRIQTEPTLSISRSAVLAPGPTARVYVEKAPAAFEQRIVRLGRKGEDYWEVLDGVQEGETVVVHGNLLIDAESQLKRPEPSIHSAHH